MDGFTPWIITPFMGAVMESKASLKKYPVSYTVKDDRRRWFLRGVGEDPM